MSPKFEVSLYFTENINRLFVPVFIGRISLLKQATYFVVCVFIETNAVPVTRNLFTSRVLISKYLRY